MMRVETNNIKDLILERPDLEITPLVSDDATSGDYPCMVGEIGKCYIDKIAQSPINDEKLLIYREDEHDFIADYMDETDDYGMSDAEFEAQAKAAYEAIDWKETILIFVDSY